jgi:hypothetical protein
MLSLETPFLGVLILFLHLLPQYTNSDPEGHPDGEPEGDVIETENAAGGRHGNNRMSKSSRVSQVI